MFSFFIVQSYSKFAYKGLNFTFDIREKQELDLNVHGNLDKAYYYFLSGVGVGGGGRGQACCQF